MRYHFEYLFQVVKWSLNAECPKRGQEHQEITDNNAKNADWDTLISHRLSSSIIPTRWVISKPPVGLGLCNRIMNSISCLLLAMATNRTLWLEWDQQESEQISSKEFAGMSSYDDLFISDFHKPHFRPPTHLIENATVNHACFLERLRFSSDLNKDFTESTIRIDKGEWWGGLLFRNKAYAKTVFKGLSHVEGFPILFRSLFTLHPPHIEPLAECSWMIQYRNIWTPPRYTASIDSFLSCAHARGMTMDDYNTTWIVSDDHRALLNGASAESLRIISSMNFADNHKTCRGPCGDRRSMETMYRMSHCRNAVLTFGSSFGLCISNLASIQRQFRVGHYGECITPVTKDPVDANTHSRYGNIATFLSELHD